MSPRSRNLNRAKSKNKEHGDVVNVKHRQNIPANDPGIGLEHESGTHILALSKITNTQLAFIRGPQISLNPLDYFSELPLELKLLIYRRLATLDQICFGLVSKRVYALHRRESKCKVFTLSEIHLIKSQRASLRFSFTYSTLASRISSWFPRESMLCRRCDRYYPAGAMHTRFECRDVQGRCRQRVIEDLEADVSSQGNRDDRYVYRAVINQRWFSRLSNRGLCTSMRRIC